MRQPRDIIGDDLLTQLAFEGWQVVPILDGRDVSKTTATRHRFEPNSKYPWFCERCGYAEHERLQHIDEKEGP